MKGEVRLVNLFARRLVGLPFENVGVGLGGGTKVGEVEVAVGVEDFRMTERDGCARWALYTQAYPTDKVLTEIENGLAGGRMENGEGAHFSFRTDWRARVGHELGGRWFEPRDGVPIIDRVAGVMPTGAFGARGRGCAP